MYIMCASSFRSVAGAARLSSGPLLGAAPDSPQCAPLPPEAELSEHVSVESSLIYLRARAILREMAIGRKNMKAST